MTFQPAAHTAQATLFWEGKGGVTWQNVMHFTKEDFDDTDMDNLISGLKLCLSGATMLNYISSDAELVKVVVTDMRTQGARQIEEAINQSGTSASDMIAQGSAQVATLRTDVRGRSYRGRFYFGGHSEDDLIDAEFTALARAALVEWLEDIRDLALISGWVLVVLSRWLDGVLRGTAIGTEVSDIVSRTGLPGSQRRRNKRP